MLCGSRSFDPRTPSNESSCSSPSKKGTEPHVVLDIANRNGGYALDFDADHITFSFGGAPSRLDAIERELTERGINRIQRTGRIALPRLAVQSQPSQS